VADPASITGESPGGAESLYPIRTVARLTGVNAVTLRAWERRYGLIKPKRTQSGHRVYTDDHVEVVRQILALLDSGISVGQVSEVFESRKSSDGETPDVDVWAKYRRRVIAGIRAFDEKQLEDTYNEAVALYPVDLVSDRLIVPTLRELGWRWKNKSGTVAEEHFFSTYIRNKLGARLHHRSRRAEGPKLVLACLPEERHDMGLLLFGLAALDSGMQVILIGADLPLHELPEVCRRSSAAAVVLAGFADPVGGDFGRKLADLAGRVAVPIYVGGRVARTSEAAIAKAGAIPLGDSMALAVRRIADSLRPA
jgi:DNA-binding transcriptional MerR regulator